MALTDPKRIITDAINDHKERTFSPYAVYLEGPPNFLTWLAQNKIMSTQLMGTNTVYKAFGKDSPMKYSLITEIPAWKITQMTLDTLEIQDVVGTEADINGELILAPGTIVPVAGDFFTINYLSNTLIFEVTEAKPNIINSNHYYKVEFQLKYSSDKSLEERFATNIVDRYTCIYENIGTDTKSVIRLEEFNIRERLQELNARLLDYYYDTYYEGMTNCFIDCPDGTNYYYNPYLVDFINNNRLYTSSEKYTHITLTFEAEKERHYSNMYRQSLYGVVESRKITDLRYNYMILSKDAYPRFSIFSQYNHKYNICCFFQSIGTVVVDEFNKPESRTVRKELFDLLQKPDNENDLTPLDIIETILYKYLKTDFVISDKDIIKLEEYYNNTANYNYHSMPIVIFLIQQSIAYYTTYKTNYKFELDRGGIDNI